MGATAATHLNFLLGCALANLSGFLGREAKATPQSTSLPQVLNTKHATFIIPTTSRFYNHPELLVEQYANHPKPKPKPSPKHAQQVPPKAMEVDSPKQPKQLSKSNNMFDALEIDPLPSLSTPSSMRKVRKVDKGTQVQVQTPKMDRSLQVCIQPSTKEVMTQTLPPAPSSTPPKPAPLLVTPKLAPSLAPTPTAPAWQTTTTSTSQIYRTVSPPSLPPSLPPSHPISSTSTAPNRHKRPLLATQTDINPKRLLSRLKHHHKMPKDKV